MTRGRLEIGVVALAVAIRAAAMVASPGAFSSDPDSYAQFAKTVREYRVFGPDAHSPSAFRPPLYPLLLVPLVGVKGTLFAGVACLHLAAAAMTTALAMSLAQKAGASRTTRHLAGLLVALDPLLVGQSTLIMTETVFTALLTALLCVWGGVTTPANESMAPPRGEGNGRSRVFLAGLLLAAAAMTRPIAWAIWFSILPLAIFERRTKKWGVALAVALLACFPWVARNWRLFGRPILTTTHGGYTLWLGQNPTYFADVVAAGGRVWPEESFQAWTKENGDRLQEFNSLASADRELRRDAYFRDSAAAWIGANPASFARTCLAHVRFFWAIAPARGPTPLRGAMGLFFLGLFGAALVGAARTIRTSPVTRLLVATSLTMTLTHAVYWSDMRMRTPLEPALAVLASLAIPARHAKRTE